MAVRLNQRKSCLERLPSKLRGGLMGSSWMRNLIWMTRDLKSNMTPRYILDTLRYGSVSKPCTPGEHQNSW